MVTSKGTVVPRRTLRPLRDDEINSEVERRKRSIFDQVILERLGDPLHTPLKLPAPDFVAYEDGELDPPPQNLVDEDPLNSEATAVFEKSLTDV